MRNYVGLDVSLKTTSICILGEKGKRLLEGEVDSTPEAIGIAEALRVGHFQECVHRSDEAVEIRTLLHMR